MPKRRHHLRNRADGSRAARLRGELFSLHKYDRPAEVCEAAWGLLRKVYGASGAGLWQRDRDAMMFVLAEFGFSDELLRARLGKMDSGVGEVVMETEEPLFVRDVAATPEPLRQFPFLRAFERQTLAAMNTRSAAIIPASDDQALMILFSGQVSLTPEDLNALGGFAAELAKSIRRAHERVVDRTLVEVGRLLSATSVPDHATMDQIADLTREMVNAGGVSIFVTSPDESCLVLAGTTGIRGVGPRGSYADCTYPLDQAKGLTPGVYLRGKPFRWPDLQHPLSQEKLEAHGLAWAHSWNEEETHGENASLAIMLQPMRYCFKAVQDACEVMKPIGVIRASIRRPPRPYFSPREEAALAMIAEMVGSFVGASRHAAAEALDSMQAIAHQFVTPLAVAQWDILRLRSLLDELLDPIAKCTEPLANEEDAPRLAAKADIARGLLDRISEMVNLACSYGHGFELVKRLWGGADGDLELEPVALDTAVFDTVKMFRPLANRRGVGMWAAGHRDQGNLHEVGQVLLDLKAFVHLLTNLLDNAAKYGKQGTTAVVSARRVGHDRVAAQVSSVSRVSILDADVERIFERGVRSSEAKRLKVTGTGTGLWLAREIARRHGGDLVTWPSSPEPEGGHRVVFEVTLKAPKTQNTGGN